MLGLTASVEVAEVINLASPTFATLSIADVDPPHVLGLFRNRQRALIGLLITAGTVGRASDVLLIRLTVNPDLPVAASDVSYEVDRLPRGDGNVIGSDSHLT